MKKNMKGFTLIELLAVIVILAIIMVVAIPQILNVINDSRKSAWESNVKMIAEAIELNDAIGNVNINGTTTGTIIATQGGCTAQNVINAADVDTKHTTITASWSSNACVVTVTPTANGQFKSNSSNAAKTLTCTLSGCTGDKN